MLNHIIRKMGYSVLVFWGVVTVIFFLFNVLPGDSSRMLMGQRSDLQSLKAIRADLGLDQPIWKRYVKYLDDLSLISVHTSTKGDYFFASENTYPNSRTLADVGQYKVLLKVPYLQRSFQSKKEVAKMIADTFFNTFLLAIISIIVASIVGIFLGVFAALFKNSWYDRMALVFTSFGMSVPSFFAAILLGWLFAYVLADITHLNLTGNLIEMDDYGETQTFMWKNLILPALTLSVRPLSVVLQLTRNSVLEVLSQDYIRTAKAKGLGKSKMIRKHVIKNALNPVITSISGWLASMMAGVVFVEYIFGWKGLGYVLVTGVNNYDIPVVIGVVLVISVIFVVITLLVDVVYAWLDPRLKHR